MRFFEWAKDGGPESHVRGFFLVEIKSLFSVVILNFGVGTREAYHTHAFSALTIWLRGRVLEEFPDHTSNEWKAGDLKYTPRDLCHRVRGVKSAWTLSFRGPWRNEWKEFLEATNEFVTLTNGRKVVARERV